MLNRLLHPDNRTLSDFADGELTAERARRVAGHVAECERCRNAVWAYRRIDAATQELDAPALPSHLLERVMALRSSGDDVILPVSAAPEPQPKMRSALRVALVAGAMVTAAAVGALVVGTSSAAADSSELIVAPAAPRAGDTIRVEYRASSRLHGQAELRLRARHARVDAVTDAFDNVVLTTLRRQRDGSYTGWFVLPEGVQYAVLAVEAMDASDVDHNGERWDVLLHGDDGRPLERSLELQVRDVRFRNRELAAELSEAMVRLYPASVRARMHSAMLRGELMDTDAARAMRAALRDSLAVLLAQQPATMGPVLLSDIVFYAGYLQDTATARTYRQRLIGEHPLAPASQQQRVFALNESWRPDTLAYWRGLDELWLSTAGVPRHGQIAFTGWQTAQVWKDNAALGLWGRRMVEEDVANRGWVGQAFAAIPELRSEGIDMLSRELRELDSRVDAVRPLTFTAAEHQTNQLRYRGRLLVDLGNALIASGRTAEGEAALAQAVDLAWEPALFRRVAEARFRAGDTTRALQLLARVAVDPATPRAFADSVRGRAGAPSDWDAHWMTWRQAAVHEMQRHIMVRATNRPVRGRASVVNTGEVAQTFDPASDGLTFVAFWSRHCPPSLMQLGQLAEVSRLLQQQGVRVVTFTDERPTPGLLSFMESGKFDYPVLFDTSREARRVFDSFGTPTYLVLDERGRVRFENHGLDDILRQVHLLLHGTAVQ